MKRKSKFDRLTPGGSPLYIQVAGKRGKIWVKNPAISPVTGELKCRRGFAAMSKQTQEHIARKGGLTVSRNRRHMQLIGAIGGSRGKKRALRKAA